MKSIKERVRASTQRPAYYFKYGKGNKNIAKQIICTSHCKFSYVLARLVASLASDQPGKEERKCNELLCKLLKCINSLWR